MSAPPKTKPVIDAGFSEPTKSKSHKYVLDALRNIEKACSTFATEEEMEAKRQAVTNARKERRMPSLPNLKPIST